MIKKKRGKNIENSTLSTRVFENSAVKKSFITSHVRIINTADYTRTKMLIISYYMICSDILEYSLSKKKHTHTHKITPYAIICV